MTKPKPLTPKDVLKIIKSETIDVLVPEWGASVRCRVPDHKTILQLRTAHEDKDEFQTMLFKACLTDFTPEQIEQLEQGNGLKYLQLFAAVMGSVDLFGNALTETNLKN